MTRFARFAAAGTGGFVVQVAAIAGLTALNVHYLVATALAVEAAIIVNFITHQLWTWRDRGVAGASVMERLVRFNALTSVTSIFGSLFLTAYLVEALGLHPVAANIVAIVALSVINFAGADRLVFRAGVVLAALGIAGSAYASGDATLQPKTAQAFSKYATAVESRRARELTSNEPFLDIERQSAANLARTIASLKRGEVIVSMAAARDGSASEAPLDGGLINHWRGTVFVPGVKLDHLLKVLQDPDSPQHKQEDVLSTRIVARGPDSQKLYLRLKRTKFVTVVYDTEYDVQYQRLSADRAMSNSLSTKIVEIENAGTARERAMPEGNDSGYMWRLNSYWRYKQFDDGVLVEVESLSLSRDLPAIIGPLIRPIVSGVARESMSRTLSAVRGRFRA
jgi:putative flippase GtrA